MRACRHFWGWEENSLKLSFSLQVSWMSHLNFVKWDLMIQCKATSLGGGVYSPPPLSFRGPILFSCYCSCYSSLQSLLSVAQCLGIFFFVVSLLLFKWNEHYFSYWNIRSWQLLPVEVIYTTLENRLTFSFLYVYLKKMNHCVYFNTFSKLQHCTS